MTVEHFFQSLVLAGALCAGSFLLPALGAAHADPAVIEAADARSDGQGWTIAVTLSHGDTGWDDYADGWRILAPDGSVLATRVLAHPHVNEQPFTRSLGGVVIPGELNEIVIEASTSTGGWDGARYRLRLAR
ncbi:hypothetical protein [Tropicimonas marinistellae]|uniref:hypothetical protein n=1 Tax=Tropicimonas marinistellae TaxID=1739787 RepID=UPI00098FD948|nr:hypothetical protein [Tropicimonas marinistellae]